MFVVCISFKGMKRERETREERSQAGENEGRKYSGKAYRG